MSQEPDYLREFDEFLENIDKPKPPKPKLEVLTEKIAAPPDLVRSREVLAQTQTLFHQEEQRQLRPNERLLRNKRLYGRARPPSQEEQQQLRRQLLLDHAIEATRARQRQEQDHLDQLNEFRMGLY
jgi:hypothetical protein